MYITENLHTESEKLIYPGSFNPIHEGHIRLAEKASQLTNKKVVFEICINHPDKPWLSMDEIKKRVDPLKIELYGKEFAEKIVLTECPTFEDKAKIFPNSTFIVGFDTFKRIADPKYYKDLNVMIQNLHKYKASFLVFHRIVDGISSAKDDTIFPEQLMQISKIVDNFSPIEKSSSQIRRTKLEV